MEKRAGEGVEDARRGCHGVVDDEEATWSRRKKYLVETLMKREAPFVVSSSSGMTRAEGGSKGDRCQCSQPRSSITGW
jgi:hypothetical protein